MAFSQSNVSSYVVDLTRVTRTGTVAQDPVQDSQLLAQQPPLPSAPLRRIYERPSTACSKPQRWAWGFRGHWGAQEAGPAQEGFRKPSLASPGPRPPFGHPRVKQNSESERRSPSSEDDRDERESRAEIRNAEDYNEIFQPKNSISRTPPRRSEPFPAPPEDGESGGRARPLRVPSSQSFPSLSPWPPLLWHNLTLSLTGSFPSTCPTTPTVCL